MMMIFNADETPEMDLNTCRQVSGSEGHASLTYPIPCQCLFTIRHAEGVISWS